MHMCHVRLSLISLEQYEMSRMAWVLTTTCTTNTFNNKHADFVEIIIIQECTRERDLLTYTVKWTYREDGDESSDLNQVCPLWILLTKLEQCVGWWVDNPRPFMVYHNPNQKNSLGSTFSLNSLGSTFSLNSLGSTFSLNLNSAVKLN